MCGIVTVVSKTNQKPDGKILKKMADTLEHRGPDAEGQFIDQSVGFHHKRLSIIDIEGGKQPMTSGNNTIVCNGEIYNYIELKEELKSLGHVFRTSSDTEVILKMYEEYGTDAIPRLNGMFSFVIYDKSRNTMLVARDHFGIKPLYYYSNDEVILFASEIKALLKYPGLSGTPCYKAMCEYLTFQFVLGENTLFKNIKKVKPGHFISIDLATCDIDQKVYWEPNFKLDLYHTEEYFLAELRELLEDTIKIQLRSDVPLGAYLSGGIDSSLVSLLASRNIPGKLKTFTGAFREGPEFDETRFSNEVAGMCEAEQHLIYPTENDFIDTLPKLMYHMDEPVAGPGLFPQYMVSKLASENVTVVLGGQGGDEIFGGYTRYIVAYLEQALKGAINETNEEKEHIVSLSSILPNLPYLRNYIPMMKNFFSREVFEPMDRRYFHLLDRSQGALELYTRDFSDNYYNREEIFAKFQQVFNHCDTLSYFNKMTRFDMAGSLPGLLHVEDRVTMAVSLESRVPLLDKRIVDLVSVMPAGMKFRGGEMKYLLKRAVKDVLPESLMNRKDKMGFPVPLHIWSKNNASGFFKDVLLSKDARERGVFNISNIEHLIDNEVAFGRSLWGILSLELWFKQFIDN
ncbi:MAG: asparagine synthase (glutamine-hydrolyzing) [Bacteroidota bacterium]